MKESVKIICSDNKEYIVNKNLIKKSILIKNIINNKKDDDLIKIPNINSVIFEKVIKWCEYHKNDETIELNEIDKWDKDFYDVEKNTIFEIINAAYYLDIKLLIDIGCKIVSNTIKNMSIKDMKEEFNITNDFTPEEEMQIIKENEWSEEININKNI